MENVGAICRVDPRTFIGGNDLSHGVAHFSERVSATDERPQIIPKVMSAALAAPETCLA
jgi:hypothetical protein